jgi:hypothetical protein
MEFFILPAIGLGSLYYISQEQKKKERDMHENFVAELPNVNLPDKNYPDTSTEDLTSRLSQNNTYSGGAYTDKFFQPPTPPLGSQNTFRSMTGESVDSSYFQHNNMVPFFGSKERSRHSLDHAQESLLDSMNGTGSQIIRKTEQRPLFSPQTNLQHTYGMPNQSDFIQSRMNVSMKMSNVKPFQDIKVAPGVGLGYGSEGMGGYNSGMLSRELWMDKNVDEMRTANKPKAGGINAWGHEGPAGSYVKSIGENDRIGRFEKNLPDTYFEMGPERYFTTVGMEKGHNLIPIPVVKDVTRPETSTEYIGGAGHKIEKEYVPGEYRPSHNQQLGSVPLAVVDRAGFAPATNNDYSSQGIKIYNTNRSITNRHSSGYFGGVGHGTIAEAFAPLLDLLRPSRKENTIGTLRPYQNVKTAVSNSYTINPYDRPKTTIKETTSNSKFHLNVNMKPRGAYESTPYQPVEQNRDTTSVSYYGSSGAPAYSLQPMSQEAEYNQRNNEKKEAVVHEYTPGAGNMNVFQPTLNQRNKTETVANERDLMPALPINPEFHRGYFSSDRKNSRVHESDISFERNNGDVLKQLKENPYVLPINGRDSL